MPPDCTMNDVNRELFAYHLDEHRERWLKRKRKFLESLQKSIEFDEFLNEEMPPLYSRLRDVCIKLFNKVERYFGETGACWDSMGGIKQCRNLHFRAGRQD